MIVLIKDPNSFYDIKQKLISVYGEELTQYFLDTWTQYAEMIYLDIYMNGLGELVANIVKPSQVNK